MKKIISIVLAAMLIAALSAVAFAGAWNPAEGCQVVADIKKADPSNVVKDGIIGANEYCEININRDPQTTDLMFSYQYGEMIDACEAMLQTAHFYMSWDEVHGLNIAAVVDLGSEPFCESAQPQGPASESMQGPNDEFIFFYGMMFRVYDGDAIFDPEILYAGFNKNTATGEYLFGNYGYQGYKGNYAPVGGQDYVVSFNGTVATYEISFPIDAVLPTSSISGNNPVDGSSIYFDWSLTSGNTGTTAVEDTNCYAISIGDFGYLTMLQSIEEPAAGQAIFKSEAVDGNNQGGGNNETGGNGGGNGSNVTAVETYLTTDAEGNTVVETRIVEKNVNNNGTNNTNAGKRTGDPMIIIAAVSAISACGVVVLKKKH